MGNPRPMLEYLLTATPPSLESFELAHLNASSNTKRKVFEILDQYLEQEAQARAARWLREHQNVLRPHACSRARPSLSSNCPPSSEIHIALRAVDDADFTSQRLSLARSPLPFAVPPSPGRA